MEDKKVSTTLLGQKIVLQDVVANVAGAVEWTAGVSLVTRTGISVHGGMTGLLESRRWREGSQASMPKS